MAARCFVPGGLLGGKVDFIVGAIRPTQDKALSSEVLPLPMDGLQRRIGITTRTGSHLSAAARALIEQIRRFST